MIRQFFLYLLFLSITLISCKKEESKIIDNSSPFDYLQPGDNSVQEFGIKTIAFANTGKEIKYGYIRRTYEVLEFNENGFGINFRVIYAKSDNRVSWEDYATTLLTINDTVVLTTINNEIEKLIQMPLSEGRVWDGNNYNTEPKTIFSSINVGQSFIKGDSINYSNTLKIDRGQLETFISSDENFTILAEGVGEVYLYDKNIGFQPGADTTGTIIEQWLLD